MPIRGIKRVQRNMHDVLDEIRNERTYKVLTHCYLIGAGYSDQMTPIDTSFLVNSHFHLMRDTRSGMSVIYGYMAEYAGWVHDAPGKLKGEPRKHFGKTREGVAFGGGTEKGQYWDPNAEPEFLRKGFEEEGLEEIIRAIERGYKV